jgi:hypothetical protein
MRPGPATRAASFVDLPACLLTARSSETTLLVRQRSRGVPHLPVLVAERRFKELTLRNLCGSQPAAQPVHRAGSGGGRNARATGTRSRALPNVPGNSPSRIASLPLASPQSSFDKLESSHVFAGITLGQKTKSRNGKTFCACAEAVDDESSLWKAEEIGEVMLRNNQQ